MMIDILENILICPNITGYCRAGRVVEPGPGRSLHHPRIHAHQENHAHTKKILVKGTVKPDKLWVREGGIFQIVLFELFASLNFR